MKALRSKMKQAYGKEIDWMKRKIGYLILALMLIALALLVSSPTLS